MNWNADNTVWNPYGATNQAKLEHLGNGQWTFTSPSISEMVETDAGSEDDYPGKLYILWEPGVLREYFDENSEKQSGTYTFTGNGPASIRIGYSYPWNEGSGTPTHYTFTESTISNGQNDNRGNNGNHGTSDENFGIEIPEVNPDNPATSSTTAITSPSEITPPSPIISLNLGPQNPGNTPVRTFFSQFMPTWPGVSRNFVINFPYYKLQSGQRVFDNRIAFTKESLTAEYRRVNGLASGASVLDSDLQTYWNSVTKIKVKFAYFGHRGQALGTSGSYSSWIASSKTYDRTPITGTITIEGTNTNVSAQDLINGSAAWPTESEFNAIQTHFRKFAAALFTDNVEYEINVPDGASDNFWLDVDAGDHISNVGGLGNSTLDGPWKGVIMGGLNIDFPEARGYALMSNEEDYEISTEQFVPILVSYNTSLISESVITINSSRGENPIQYSIDGSTYQDSNTFNVNLSPGNYTAYAKDAINCIATHPFTVAVTAPVTVTAAEQLPNLASPIECNTGMNISRVINTGKGFTSITDMQALIPSSGQFIGGNNASRLARISFGLGTNPYGQTGSALDSEGKLIKWCMNNVSFDEDDMPLGPHYLYFFSNPLSLWVKAQYVWYSSVGSDVDNANLYLRRNNVDNSEFVWNEGWQPGNWSSTPPDLTKNHAIVQFYPNFEMVTD